MEPMRQILASGREIPPRAVCFRPPAASFQVARPQPERLGSRRDGLLVADKLQVAGGGVRVQGEEESCWRAHTQDTRERGGSLQRRALCVLAR